MRNALFLCASLVLTQSALAAYSVTPDETQHAYKDISHANACAVIRAGFAHLQNSAVTRQANLQWAEVLKKTTTPAELVWMLGASQSSAFTDAFLSTGRPLEMVAVTSATFLKGFTAFEDKAGFAMVMVFVQMQGVCAE